MYPGRVIRKGEADQAIVALIVNQLAARGYRGAAAGYDSQLAALVKLFQAQNVDAAGRPLLVDGEVGPMTWGALFGASPVASVPTGEGGRAMAVAISQLGVMEEPLGSNKGPEVDEYLKSTGVPPGNYWCMAFVYWCFREAANGGATAFPKTAGCLDAWNKVKAKVPQRLLHARDARANPDLVRPGLVFILDYGNGYGHTGFVKQSIGGALRTVEGNTDGTGSGNGLGVFELNRRKTVDQALKGFIDFT